MAEQITKPATTAADHDLSWSHVWHLPVLLLGLALFVIGIWLAVPSQKRSPNVAAHLRDARTYLAAANHEEAEHKLGQVHEHLNQASRDQKAEYWQARADLIYLQQQRRTSVPVDTKVSRQNNKKIVDCYRQAEKLGRTIDDPSVARYARTLAALGRDDEALELVNRLKEAPAERRYRILRELIERKRDDLTDTDPKHLAILVEQFRRQLPFEPDRSKRRGQEIWLATVDSQLLLDAGDPQRAIDFLVQRLVRLVGPDREEDLAPLDVLLAEAYQQVGDFDQAERKYLQVQQKIESTDGLNARILLGLGQITLAIGGDQHIERALEHFRAADDRYPSEPVYIDALVGRADCEARLDDFPQAIEHFGQAVDTLAKRLSPEDPRRQVLTDVMRSHIERNWDRQRYDLALELLMQLQRLYAPQLPPELLLEFARTYEKIADQHKAYAAGLEEHLRLGTGPASPEAMRKANQDAALNYDDAGRYYFRHAKEVTLDDAAHGQSLWKAANCFDRGQNWLQAIEVYSEFVNTRHTDARRLEAISRLGKAYMSYGQYESAVELFLRLLNEHPQSPVTAASLVPLARAYVAMDAPDKAERTLLNVVDDHKAIKPDSPLYQDALIELGKLYYHLGEADTQYLKPAIVRLETAVQRYGRTEHSPTLRFLLADAYRRSIPNLNEDLARRQSQAEKLALQAERKRRLEQAQMYYNQVINELEARPPSGLSPLDHLYHRNAYFYQADTAFDRSQYEVAIELYDTAARYWSSDPASLVALVQIVNAYCELGRFQEAEAANLQARRHLERIPEEAFDDPNLPMTRRHWEDWLRWTSELNLFKG